MVADGAELASGVSIEITSNPVRLVRDLIATISIGPPRRTVESVPSLTEWARHRGFEPARHHQLIIREIEAFLDSDDEVLLLFAPPGSGKSHYVSVLLPSWYLANNPTHSILAATHSVEFAERWGRRIRNDIALDGATLGIGLADDSRAAARWSLAIAEGSITVSEPAWVLVVSVPISV
jgi:hypothetical protein